MISTFPLMALVLIAYNGLMFGLVGSDAQWSNEVLSIPMVSGASWKMTIGDLMITFGMVMLFFEILKATRIGKLSIIDHLVSTVVLLVFLVEFLLVAGAATSVFFILMLMTLVDVMAGFSVSIRSATRDVDLSGGI